MKPHEKIERLNTRLHWESGGVLAPVASEVTAVLLARLKALADWVRENAEERPLISVLGAFQLGFAAGSWGARRAKH
jgi:hypothetical protein